MTEPISEIVGQIIYNQSGGKENWKSEIKTKMKPTENFHWFHKFCDFCDDAKYEDTGFHWENKEFNKKSLTLYLQNQHR